MNNFLTQWKTKEENLRINLIKNFLTQWETKEKNRKIGGNVPFIDRNHNGNILFIDWKCSDNILLINRKHIELKDDAKCISLSKLIKLVKKPSNLTRTGKEKPHCPISYSLTFFVKRVRRPCFCFAESLMGLTYSLAIGKAESRKKEVAVSFSG